ncbi:MAG: hypothetical protein K0S16_2305, partial [Moraxellaceae bacterium]|nr:hypothetical protein [Moraxellaceae bacterium]
MRAGLLLVLALCLPSAALAAAADIEIEGVSGDLEDNVEAYVGRVTVDELDNWRSTRARLYQEVKEA